MRLTRRLLIGFAGLFLAASPLLAESALDGWLKKLDKLLTRSEAKHRSRSMAVAAVRGNKEGEASKGLYWKGKKQAVTPEEFAEFKTSVALLQEGKTTEGQASLEKFIAAHPSSPLLVEAKKTLELVKAAPAPAAPAAQ